MIFLANFKTDTSFQSARTAVITTFTWPRREVVNIGILQCTHADSRQHQFIKLAIQLKNNANAK